MYPLNDYTLICTEEYYYHVDGYNFSKYKKLKTNDKL